MLTLAPNKPAETCPAEAKKKRLAEEKEEEEQQEEEEQEETSSAECVCDPMFVTPRLVSKNGLILR